MASEREDRKLAAILAADMVGYSRLMEADERGTVARQKAHREELIDPSVTQHKGRIVKTTGDGLLVEFASAVDAVHCAVEIQRGMAELESGTAQDQRIAYRIGINIGDIIIDGDDILGDGVNVAARMEALAEPGGICISRNVFSQVKNKVEPGFADLGPQKVKNITEPVPTYKILLDPAAAGTVVAAKRTLRTPLRWAASGMAAAVIVVAGLAWWQPWASMVEPARLAKMAFPLPKEPSIAVLPFDNLTGDKTQDYLTYGIAGKITAKLAKTSGIFVITRPAAFGYYRRRKTAVEAGKAAEDLGVRHVLMGSVQKSGDKLRVTVQLVDAVSGRQMWAEQYDGAAKEIFAFQDEIAQKVIAELEVKLTVGEQARIWRKQTKSQDAYNLFMRGVFHYQRRTRTENAQAQKIFKQVVRMDPDFAEAQCQLGFTYVNLVRYRWSKDPRADLARAEALARKAITKDPDYPHAYSLLASIALRRRQHDQALANARKALELEPQHANNIGLLAWVQQSAGQPAEAVVTIKRAMRFYPSYPTWFLGILADSYRQLGKYDEAIFASKKRLERTPRAWPALAWLAVTYVQAGRLKEARRAAKQLRALKPNMTAKLGARYLGFFYKNPQEAVRIKAALLKAGLPE